MVHKLHGATRYTGVPKLQKCSHALEESLKLRRYPQVPEQTRQLLVEIDRVLDWYEKKRTRVT